MPKKELNKDELKEVSGGVEDTETDNIDVSTIEEIPIISIPTQDSNRKVTKK